MVPVEIERAVAHFRHHANKWNDPADRLLADAFVLQEGRQGRYEFFMAAALVDRGFQFRQHGAIERVGEGLDPVGLAGEGDRDKRVHLAIFAGELAEIIDETTVFGREFPQDPNAP